MIKLLTPKNSAILDTFTDFQNRYCKLIETEGTDAANAWLAVAKEGIERSHPNVFTFEWESDADTEFTFELS